MELHSHRLRVRYPCKINSNPSNNNHNSNNSLNNKTNNNNPNKPFLTKPNNLSNRFNQLCHRCKFRMLWFQSSSSLNSNLSRYRREYRKVFLHQLLRLPLHRRLLRKCKNQMHRCHNSKFSRLLQLLNRNRCRSSFQCRSQLLRFN